MRYKTSLLGASWLVLQPLAMILVYTLVFSQVMQTRMPGNTGEYAYSIYLCSGLLTWGLFAEILLRSKNVFIENANMLKKLSFPRVSLLVIVTVSACLNFLIIFGLFIVFLILTGNFNGVMLLYMAPVLLLQVAFSFGVGMIVGVLNVFFRDVGQLVDVLLQFLFWATPIVYTISILPAWLHSIILMNPLARLIIAYQTILVNQQPPHWYSLWPVLLLTIIVCLLGQHLFNKHAADMVDEL